MEGQGTHGRSANLRKKTAGNGSKRPSLGLDSVVLGAPSLHGSPSPTSMSDSIGHECGIALLRLRKPISYYQRQYGTPYYGLQKLYLMMEKQHNRGQDGAGVATIKLQVPAGTRYISRARSVAAQPLKDLFERIYRNFSEAGVQGLDFDQNLEQMQEALPYLGELLLGHLRYGTHGKNTLEACHPFLRQHNYRSRNLVLAGNFNLTNVDRLFEKLVNLGQHPKEMSDTVTVMENIGHYLDQAHRELSQELGQDPAWADRNALEKEVGRRLDLVPVLRKASRDWDGGFAMAGLLGHGDAFVLRDAHGIRPAYWFANDEVVAVASERPAMATALGVDPEQIQEIPAGHALWIRADGSYGLHRVFEETSKTACSFERIYFSRGNDPQIYRERKKLGELLVPQIMESVGGDLDNTVFSYIPNTAESAFLGMLQGLESHLHHARIEALHRLDPESLRKRQGDDYQEFIQLMERRPRVEKAAIKDAKLRTFITDDHHRNDLVRHVYDTTSGILRPGLDALVVMDDSIVRGTTLRESIVSILGGLKPRLLVVVSSAPTIRYPDCYGIDMSRLGDFIAFQALINLLQREGLEAHLKQAYQDAKADLEKTEHPLANRLQSLYARVSDQALEEEIARLLTPVGLPFPIRVVYQKISDLHIACPGHRGDWYFGGQYPTPGGHRVANRALVYYMDQVEARPY